MSDQHHVLVVDDEPFNFEYVEMAIGGKYRLSHAASGEDALTMAAAEEPEVILLDIRMPGMDGYETCRRLREQVEAPVIFVSALDSLEERMAGYEAGGSDFLTKPFAAGELEKKIAVALQYRNERAALRDQASAAMDTAMVAMTSAGELGVVLQFLGKSFNCHSIEALAEQVIASMDEFSLPSTVQIRSDGQVHNLAGGDVVSALEVDVLDYVCNHKRILQYGQQVVINYPHISLLIKEMPLEDPDLCGRIRDNVALLVEGAESRVRALEVEASVKRQKGALAALMKRTEQALKEIDARHREHKQVSTSLMEDLLERLDESFMVLGLSDEQEASLMAMTSEAVTQALALYDKGLAVDEHLDKVVSDLNRALEAA